jgi:hypothetical protein
LASIVFAHSCIVDTAPPTIRPTSKPIVDIVLAVMVLVVMRSVVAVPAQNCIVDIVFPTIEDAEIWFVLMPVACSELVYIADAVMPVACSELVYIADAVMPVACSELVYIADAVMLPT